MRFWDLRAPWIESITVFACNEETPQERRRRLDRVRKQDSRAKLKPKRARSESPNSRRRRLTRDRVRALRAKLKPKRARSESPVSRRRRLTRNRVRALRKKLSKSSPKKMPKTANQRKAKSRRKAWLEALAKDPMSPWYLPGCNRLQDWQKPIVIQDFIGPIPRPVYYVEYNFRRKFRSNRQLCVYLAGYVYQIYNIADLRLSSLKRFEKHYRYLPEVIYYQALCKQISTYANEMVIQYSSIQYPVLVLSSNLRLIRSTFYGAGHYELISEQSFLRMANKLQPHIERATALFGFERFTLRQYRVWEIRLWRENGYKHGFIRVNDTILVKSFSWKTPEQYSWYLGAMS